MTTTTTGKRLESRRGGGLTLLGAGLGLLVGTTTAGSCIIPDHGIHLVCGRKWYAQAPYAQGFDGNNGRVTIDDAGKPAKGYTCVPSNSSGWNPILQCGDDLDGNQPVDCFDNKSQQACKADSSADCIWLYDTVCVWNNAQFQQYWLEAVDNAYQACLDLAASNNLEPEPDCNPQADQSLVRRRAGLQLGPGGPLRAERKCLPRPELRRLPGPVVVRGRDRVRVAAAGRLPARRGLPELPGGLVLDAHAHGRHLRHARLGMQQGQD